MASNITAALRPPPTGPVRAPEPMAPPAAIARETVPLSLFTQIAPPRTVKTPAAPSPGDALRSPTGIGISTGGTPAIVPSPLHFPAATADFDARWAYQTLLPQLEAVAAPAERPNLRDSLQRYVTAYANFTRDNPGVVQGDRGLLVNFGAQSATDGRGFIIDMENLALIRGPMPVSHGGGFEGDEVEATLSPTAFRRPYGGAGSPFSNDKGSARTPLGVFTTSAPTEAREGEPQSIGLQGRSVGFNDDSGDRGIVLRETAHAGELTDGSPGLSRTERESSDGVVETDMAAATRLLGGDSSFVFLDAPVSGWHGTEPWLSRPFDVRPLGRTVGLRNNNPWNVKSVGWDGETGRDGRNHARFGDATYSARAAARQLTRYYDGTSDAAGRRELRTLQQIFNVYAPASDTVGSIPGREANQPNTYADWVAGEMGISATEDIHLLRNGRIDARVAVPLLDAIARYENARDLELPAGLILAGLSRL